MLKMLTPNSIDCQFYSASREEELKWLRANGGMTAIILHGCGKKTAKELKAMKRNNKRKPRADKGKKRKPKAKAK